MFRALLPLLLVPAAVVAAPAPKGDVVYYLPVKVGDKRVYEAKSADRTSVITEVVTKVTEKDGRLLVTITRELKKTGLPTTYEVSPKGVFRLVSGDKDTENAFPLLKLPAKAGDSWVYAPESKVSMLKITNTVVKEEEIEVPAGKFKAIRIESEMSSSVGKGGKVTYWYAPGVGLVKQISQLPEGDHVQVLKSFTPGK